MGSLILNKPGKLTDEEYEIMKTHSELGMQIIDKAISNVEADGYLQEARNMAATITNAGTVRGIRVGLKVKRFLWQRASWQLRMFSML